MFHMPRSSYLLIKSSRFPDTFAPLQASQRLRIATVQCSAGLGNSAPGISLSVNFNFCWVLMFTSWPDAMLELRPPKQPHSPVRNETDPVSRATSRNFGYDVAYERRPSVHPLHVSRCQMSGYFGGKVYGHPRQSRRSYLSLLECHKTIRDYFEFNCYGKTRSNRSFKLRQPLARVNCFLPSVFVRIIKQWNAVRKEIVHEQDFNIFRSKLRKYCEIL